MDDRDIFETAIDAAVEAFQAKINAHFGRTFDCTPEDKRRLLLEYKASAALLRAGTGVHLRTGLIDADFNCWHSDLADENFSDEARAIAEADQ